MSQILPVWRAALVLALAALCSSSESAAACTREQAFNRMMALNQYGMKLQASLPDPLKDPQGYEARYARVNEFSTRLGAVGKPLADQKYEQACASYDALAKDYHVDLAAQAVRPLTSVEAVPKQGDKAGCDLAEASRRSMRLTESFQNKARAENLGRDDWQRFGKRTEAVGLLMQQDPAKACVLIESIAREYNFTD